MLSKLLSLKLAKPSSLGGSTVIFSLSSKKKVNKPAESIETNQDVVKFVFDQNNKASIFKHTNGENDLKWMVRGSVIFTLLNSFLFVSEIANPVFGGWNGLSFTLCTFLGLGMLTSLNILSKRTISEIKLLRSGDFIEITYFNAFWVPKTVTYHISEFANFEPTYFNYWRTELTSYGKAWINLEKNIHVGTKEYEDAVIEVLSGKPIHLSKIDKIAHKYNKLKK